MRWAGRFHRRRLEHGNSFRSETFFDILGMAGGLLWR
jgi:hypothetical protein